MAPLLAYVELKIRDTDGGNNGPIQPGGGFPEHRKHAVGFLSLATPKSKVRLRTLADLRLRVAQGASPDGARICVYSGKGENPTPLVDQNSITLRAIGSRVRFFAIDPSSTAGIDPFIQANNTVGIEISSPPGPVPIKVSSALGAPAKAKTRSRTKARKSKARRSKARKSKTRKSKARKSKAAARRKR